MRVALARLTSQVVWRWPRREVRLLRSFSRAEASSLLDMVAAARLTPSEARRAAYLRHALDEARHARMFAARADQIDGERGRLPQGVPRADYEALYERLGEVGFLAFVHRGERRGRRQFEAHRDHFARIGDARGRALFEAILSDERRHESYTRELLVELAGEAGARNALRRAAAWEAWRIWRRAGRFVAALSFGLLMTTLFVALAPLGLVMRLASPSPKGWLKP
jgi:rubrerythrin